MLNLYLSLLDSPEEKSGFTAAYERYKRLVYHCAYEVLHDEYLAEDILQEVFLYLAQNYARLPTGNPHKLARYLVLAARTRAVSLLRRQGRETPAEFTEDAAPPSPEPTPEDALVDVEQTARLLALVGELKEIYRAPLELLAQGLGYRQIAGLLDLPEPTVRQRVKRARDQLYRALAESDTV